MRTKRPYDGWGNSVATEPKTSKPPKFNVGDRVQRLANVYANGGLMLRGRVTKRYDHMSPRYGYYPELYEVEWDGGGVVKGFLPHGLDPEQR